uniref:Cytokine receptor common subunit beta N-terminal domain-containing protein n=1 Tax=Spermophilus dauricus TaxID=99837 RepID=A0A8C9QN24_SPEDA
ADREMALTWGLLLLALQAPWGQGVTGTEETIPLKTLRCYNNYTSRIVCRWADTQDALRLLNLTLHRRVNGDLPQPVACEINKDTSSRDCPAPLCVHRKCLIPYQEFALADHDYYFFQPDRPLGSQLRVPLAQHGDEAQPRNLQCVFDGAHTLGCSWEVRSPVISSVSFGLFYASSPEAQEEECSPVLKEELSGLYTRLRCQIPVPDPGARGLYVVSVRPRSEGRFIKSSDNIQMERPTLKVTKDGDSYSLRWQVEKMYYTHLGQTFEVQYRRDAEDWGVSLPWPWPWWLARSRVLSDTSVDNLELSITNGHVIPGDINSVQCPLVGPAPRTLSAGCGGTWSCPPGTCPSCRSTVSAQLSPWLSLFSHRVPSKDFGDCEVSPLTIEDPQVPCHPPSGPDTTPAASGLPTETPPGAQPGPAAPPGRAENRLPSFDFNGPYLGPPHSRSLPDIQGQPEPPQSQEPALTGSLEYLCLPPGGQVQLVPLAQGMGQGQAVDGQGQPSPAAQQTLSLESRGDPAPPAPGLGVGEQDPKPSPVVSSGDPEDPGVASAYVTTADLALALPTGTLSVSLAPPLSPTLVQNPSVCPRPPDGPLGAPDPGKPGFEGYVELPPTMGQCPQPPTGSAASPVSSTPILSPGEPREEVALASPPAEGLLVLQQDGDYCFLPGLGPGPLSPQSKPPCPEPCPEVRDPWQPKPHVPAIQLFKSLKHQDYLSLLPRDISRPGQVC